LKAALSKHRLFAYGTLQLPERVEAIIGRQLPTRPAVIEGYRCGMVSRADFPGAVPATGARLDGLLLGGIQDGELMLLDRYEGELYHRIQVTAECSDGLTDAWLYVLVPWARGRLTDEAWSIDGYRNRMRKVRFTYRT